MSRLRNLNFDDMLIPERALVKIEETLKLSEVRTQPQQVYLPIYARPAVLLEKLLEWRAPWQEVEEHS